MAVELSVSEAFRAGANGYVLKQSAFEELRTAIEYALNNKRFVSSQIHADVREAMEDQWMRPEGYSSELTERSTRYIAETLHISMKTVEFHKTRITRKLGVQSVAELTKFAVAEGLTKLET